MDNATDWQVKENLESLLRQGTDPFRGVLERGLEKGLKVYPDIRAYDCQTGIDLDPMNRAHPQWRIGEHARHGPAALLYGQRVTKEYHNDNDTWQLDFAHPQVRQRTIDIAEEMLTRYEVEGPQLDFERRPHFFRPEMAVQTLEARAWRQAVEGDEQPPYHHAKVCGAVRKYSDVLLIFLLKVAAPDKYREQLPGRRSHTGPHYRDSGAKAHHGSTNRDGEEGQTGCHKRSQTR